MKESQIGVFEKTLNITDKAEELLSKYLKYPEYCGFNGTMYVSATLDAIKEALSINSNSKVELHIDRELQDDLAGLARYVAAEIKADDVELRKWCVERAIVHWDNKACVNLVVADEMFDYIKNGKPHSIDFKKTGKHE